jgi:hypothetical protein
MPRSGLRAAPSNKIVEGDIRAIKEILIATPRFRARLAAGQFRHHRRSARRRKSMRLFATRLVLTTEIFCEKKLRRFAMLNLWRRKHERNVFAGSEYPLD